MYKMNVKIEVTLRPGIKLQTRTLIIENGRIKSYVYNGVEYNIVNDIDDFCKKISELLYFSSLITSNNMDNCMCINGNKPTDSRLLQDIVTIIYNEKLEYNFKLVFENVKHKYYIYRTEFKTYGQLIEMLDPTLSWLTYKYYFKQFTEKNTEYNSNDLYILYYFEKDSFY